MNLSRCCCSVAAAADDDDNADDTVKRHNTLVKIILSYILFCYWIGRDHWGDPDTDGRIILRWIFRKWEGVVGTGWSWLRIGTGDGQL